MIHTSGCQFKDEYGRTLMLRGVNLGGSSKVPFSPNGATYVRDNFFDHCNVSFVGRPFPLAEADEHFSRLKAWGLTFLRFLVTWEAIEHAGPDIYDQEYLDYVRKIAEKAGEYSINMFIDPHQDVWSRFSGGDGAPGWTLEAVGLDMEKQRDKSNIHSGGRALKAVVRPYPRAIAGVPLRMSFNPRRCEFELEFKHDPEVNAPTELYVPDLQYPHGYRIEVSDGVYETKRDCQAVLYWHSRESSLHKIKIVPQV